MVEEKIIGLKDLLSEIDYCESLLANAESIPLPKPYPIDTGRVVAIAIQNHLEFLHKRLDTLMR